MSPWRKSSYSGGQGEHVEVAVLPGGGCAVPDSKDPHGPVLAVASADWQAFTDRIKGR